MAEACDTPSSMRLSEDRDSAGGEETRRRKTEKGVGWTRGKKKEKGPGEKVSAESLSGKRVSSNKGAHIVGSVAFTARSFFHLSGFQVFSCLGLDFLLSGSPPHFAQMTYFVFRQHSRGKKLRPFYAAVRSFFCLALLLFGGFIRRQTPALEGVVNTFKLSMAGTREQLVLSDGKRNKRIKVFCVFILNMLLEDFVCFSLGVKVWTMI